MPARAPISEVLVVMPSVTINCVPMTAPTTQSGAINARLGRLKNAGCRSAVASVCCISMPPFGDYSAWLLLPQTSAEGGMLQQAVIGGRANSAPGRMPAPNSRTRRRVDAGRSFGRSRGGRARVMPRAFRRDISIRSVGVDGGLRPLFGIAEPRPTSEADLDHAVRTGEGHEFARAAIMEDLAGAIQHDAARLAATLSAEQTVGGDADTLRIDREQRGQAVV